MVLEHVLVLVRVARGGLVVRSSTPASTVAHRVGQPWRSASGQKLAVRYPHMDRARALDRKFPRPSPENREPVTKVTQ